MSNYAVQQYATSDLSPEIACQVESYIRLIFMTDTQGEDRFFRLTNIADPVQHFVIVERDILISHALVGCRQIEHGGETYMLYGVGAVMTNPSFRDEGLGGRVVAAASDYIRAQGDADVGMLFTYPAIEHFYARYGWTHLPDPGVKWGDRAKPLYEADAFIMMLFVSDRANAHRADFDHGPIYVGHSRW